MDLGMMQNMIWQMFAQQRNNWPAALKDALNRFEVQLVRDPSEIRVICKNYEGVEGDPNVEKAKALLLDAIVPTLSKIIAAFGPKTKVFK